jgi:hypothetical protein
MSVGEWASWLARNGQRSFAFSHRSGWFEFSESPPREPLRRLTRAEYSRLGEDHREDYDDCRRIWNVNIPVIRTHQMVAAFELLDQVMYSNARDGGRIKGGVAIDAPPGLGKTTIATIYARQYHRKQIRRLGARTDAGHQRVPVASVPWVYRPGLRRATAGAPVSCSAPPRPMQAGPAGASGPSASPTRDASRPRHAVPHAAAPPLPSRAVLRVLRGRHLRRLVGLAGWL